MTEVRSAGSDALSGPARIAPSGDLDLASGSSLVARVEAELQLGGDGPVLIDLAHVQFMDSSGLRALLDAQDRCRLAGRPMALASLGPAVSRLMDIVALRERFDIIDRGDER